MMRVGKGNHQEERLATRTRQIFARTLGNPLGRIKLLRNSRADGLRADIIRRQRILRADQRTRIRLARQQPARIVAAQIVAMAGDQFDMIETVKRRTDREIGRLPIIRLLLSIDRIGKIVAQGFGEFATRHMVPFPCRGPLHHRRVRGEVLQMTLADERGRIAGVAQQFDKSDITA
jgi:hypothetical protein